MKCTIVVRSLNEADRLRLMLTALTRQTIPCEVIVANDGSIDDTVAVIAEFADQLDLRAIHNDRPHGRSAASNAGAAIATGDVLLFMDGDTLLAPDGAERHLDIHRRTPNAYARGANHHLRCTRFLRDPETASPQPGQEDRLARLSAAEREKLKVTAAQVRDSFGQDIVGRAAPGVYPGFGPARLYELERDALENHPDCSVLWAAAAGANVSMPRAAFLALGGFDPDIDNSEHRELALRMTLTGCVMKFVAGAHSYHLTHRSGWRDPLELADWERIFYQRHPILAVKLLAIFWAGIAQPSPVPPYARIANFAELEAAATGRNGIDYDAVRRMIPGLQDLGTVRC